mmetsp:Transcript_40008/g.125197  ORF Transcript_40008/g.125197 Transcript_40008/m.125197 type:complete len:327 (-) Transcript_40008:73-1053(-)
MLGLFLMMALQRLWWGASGRMASGTGSWTALAVAGARSWHHAAGLINDPYAASFLPWHHRPINFVFAAINYCNGGGSFLHHNYLAARTAFLDAYVEYNAAGGAGDVVLLGAGFDSRAYRLNLPPDTRIWEVDAPATQAEKRRVVAAAGVKSKYDLTHVAVDFMSESWVEKLVEAGFDKSRPALFVWEGVIYYLERPAVLETLRLIGECAEGSCVAFDYFTRDIADPARDVALSDFIAEARGSGGRMSQGLYAMSVRKAVRSFGEPFRFGLDESELAPLLAEFGLKVRTTVDDSAMTEVYSTPSGGGAPVGRMPFFARFCMAEVADH